MSETPSLKPAEQCFVNLSNRWDNTRFTYERNSFVAVSTIQDYGTGLLERLALKFPEIAAKIKTFEVD